MDYRNNGQGYPDQMRQLIQLNKKQLKCAHITTAAAAAALVIVLAVLVLLVPRTLNLMTQAEDALKTVDTLASDAAETLAKTAETVDSAEKLVRAADSLVTENTQAVTEALEKINSVDFQRLNDAISNFADAIEPLTKLKTLFGG